MPLLDLDRFVRAQHGAYDDALAELRAGRKRTHWMWFVFPQLDGLGSSPNARFFALSGLDDARAFLDHPVLGPRLREAASALLALDADIADIMGYPDDLKLRSSMTLFSRVEEEPFQRVLERFYDGPDERTLALLGGGRPA